MWKFKFLYFVLAVAALCATQASPAMALDGPGGSWQQTCLSSTWNAGTQVLTASCPTQAYNAQKALYDNTGKYVHTTVLHVNLCDPTQNISNIDGFLTCIARPGTWGGGLAVPGGSYLNSCLHMHVLNRRLGADCQTSSGSYNHSVVELDTCPMWSEPNHDIYNNGGNLWCSGVVVQTPVSPQQKQQSNAVHQQLDSMGCTEQLLAISCPSEQAYQICASAVHNHTLLGVVKCNAPGNIGRNSDSADKMLAAAGCHSYLGRPGEYICPAHGGAYDLCNRMRQNGSVTNCVAEMSPNIESTLQTLGCTRFLGRKAEYICPAGDAMKVCTKYLGSGDVLTCKQGS